MEKSGSAVKLGIIGLGPRGQNLAATLLQMRDEAVIVAICDRDQSRVEHMRNRLKEAGVTVKCFNKSAELLALPEVDGVLIPTSWNDHIPLAIEAVKAGKHVGMEVGGATGCEELWELVRQAESHNANAMMLENCCYGRTELMVMNMARQGLFGELLHCECGYGHYIGHEMLRDGDPSKERAWHNMRRNGDLYPTHGIGPIAKILDINRGNRFLTLSSFSSKGRTMDMLCGGKHHFNCGDVTTTVIKCANGETVTVIHNVLSPRPYSRRGVVQGTKGIWSEDCDGIYIEGRSPVERRIDAAGLPYSRHLWEPAENYYEEFEHPIWQEFHKNPIGGHGGMDILSLRSFCYSIANNVDFAIDIYDTAVWMSITALSEQSIAMGGMPVPVPDFTCGKWVTRGRAESGFWTL